MTSDKLIEEIIKIMNLPGEEYTDGECLEEIAELLEANGHKVYSHSNAEL
jgi:hypothetical protein